MVLPLMAIPWYADCTIAFSSACEHRQSSSAVPPFANELHRGQPPSLQFFTPRGVPLYPVEIILLSFTITAATFRFTQLLLIATSFAMFMKYSSHEGRLKSTGVFRRSESTFSKSSDSEPVFSIVCSAICAHASSCCALALSDLLSCASIFLNSSRVLGSPSLLRSIIRSNLFDSGEVMFQRWNPGSFC